MKATKGIILLALLASAALRAATTGTANFGPDPTCTTDNPNIVISVCKANESSGAIVLKVNGVRYAGTGTFYWTSATGDVNYYQSNPTYLYNYNRTKVAQATVMTSAQRTNKTCNPQCRWTWVRHVLGGSVQLL